MSADSENVATRDAHPAPVPHPFPRASSAEPQQENPGYAPNGEASTNRAVPPIRQRRGWLIQAAWATGAVLVAGLLIQGGILGTTFLADAVATSGYQSGRSGTVLSDVWTVDGVDLVYVEAGGSECESDSCWEWLLMTQPDCATATVTVEISDSVYGDTQREIKRSVTTDRVASVLVEAEPDDGEYADLTSISCD